MFADDIALWPRKADNASLSSALQILDNWARSWQIKFSHNKCKLLNFQSAKAKHEELVLEMAGERLEQVRTYKYLGTI